MWFDIYSRLLLKLDQDIVSIQEILTNAMSDYC